ncbi:thiamine phosphate synthase [Brevundimonas sp. FT23042]|uniref:thiamine phosphate synthase n=1 Tax=Brevundimonas sp. FT23042 TaxID=3393749 RepID=UPI003B58AE28
MNRSDADTLWRIAGCLAREAPKVSRPAGRPRRELPPLLFFTDPGRTPEPWRIAGRLPAGSGVVYRHFGAPDALETARRLREATGTRDVLLLIGRDAALADAVEADGVHLPEAMAARATVLAARRPDWILTAAFHGHAESPDFESLDALVASPVFPAGGPSSASPPLGVEGLAAIVRGAACPVYALGGIDASNASALIGSGACGIAGVSSIRTAYEA